MSFNEEYKSFFPIFTVKSAVLDRRVSIEKRPESKINQLVIVCLAVLISYCD